MWPADYMRLLLRRLPFWGIVLLHRSWAHILPFMHQQSVIGRIIWTGITAWFCEDRLYIHGRMPWLPVNTNAWKNIAKRYMDSVWKVTFWRECIASRFNDCTMRKLWLLRNRWINKTAPKCFGLDKAFCACSKMANGSFVVYCICCILHRTCFKPDIHLCCLSISSVGPAKGSENGIRAARTWTPRFIIPLPTDWLSAAYLLGVSSNCARVAQMLWKRARWLETIRGKGNKHELNHVIREPVWNI